MRSLTLVLLPALLLAGCMSKQQIYSVTVENRTKDPLIVGVAKDGPPFEEDWAAPEDLAVRDPRGIEHPWGVTIPPGKTGTMEATKGTFPRGVSPWLRVYAGELTFPDLLAIGRRSPNRADVRLTPGANHITITRTNAALAATRTESTSQSASAE